MLLLGVDFETTGLDPQKDRVIEIGAVLWDTDRKMPIEILSTLVDPEIDISPEIEAITGITNDDIKLYGETEEAAFKKLGAMTYRSDCCVAHWAEFDQGFYSAGMSRFELPNGSGTWICTANDIVYPESITTRNLKHLGAEHDFLNPFSHRAVFDVLTMFRILDCYPLDQVIARSKEPTLTVAAYVSFEEKEKAKEKGYRWAPKSKTWWRKFKQGDYLKDRDTCGFKTGVIQGVPE